MAHLLRSTLLASVTALSMAFASLPAHALDDKQKKEMGEFIKQYLIENPEIMLEVQDALERKQYATRNAKAAEAVADNQKTIFESKYDLALGNPDGDVTLVEFFDYNCGYCKRAMGDMDNILKTDKKVRVVLKEFRSSGRDRSQRIGSPTPSSCLHLPNILNSSAPCWAAADVRMKTAPWKSRRRSVSRRPTSANRWQKTPTTRRCRKPTSSPTASA